ncbi:GNAT family N-acetyltransferase [Salipiger bermudensis]|uniref:GNAT family N-acetyltransferase n=1 Tax=Salipiger bermudensis TaxID=344736 RepID=UPI001C99C4BB|nr:GNAT family N-acetyltransferase [Salipiger bermudensis]MBY6005374.1 GNAT family N-acetyltransferase [Salipiger bermudensis]
MRQLTAIEAAPFFEHKSQRLFDLDPYALPEEGFEYWADQHVCGVFHKMPWPGVWGGHYGVKPEGWGRSTEPAKRILRAFWDAHECERIIGWTPESNRAAIAFARRLGFVKDGTMPLGSGNLIMQGWTPWQ